jgi:hypothetical protein
MRGAIIYEDQSRYDLWLKAILFGVLALTLGLGLYFLSRDVEAAATLLGVTVFDALLFNFIMPRSFQIYTDRLVIVLGRPFSLTVPLHDIKTAGRVSGLRTMSYSGVRFATSVHGVVEITRSRGMNVVISPSHPDLFLEQLDQARKMASV